MDGDEALLLLGGDEDDDDGWETAGSEDDDTGEEQRENVDREITFDTALPGTHSYLGESMDEFCGCTLMEDHSKVTLPLYPLSNVVLMPGQTLPLHIYEPRYVSMVRHVMASDRTFATVFFGHGIFSSLEGQIGCTAQIFAAKEESSRALEGVSVKTVGRQRFQVLACRRQTAGILTVDVEILPDRQPPPIPHCLFAPPACFAPISHDSEEGHAVFDNPPWCSLSKAGREIRKMRYRPGSLCQWPYQLFQRYDISMVIASVHKELQSWTHLINIKSLPRNPIRFSFWLATNLPLHTTLRQQLLAMDCPLRRLLRVLSLMKSCSNLICAVCGSTMCKRKDIFSMSQEGPQAAYVNRYGHVHETLTVYEVSGMRVRGRPETKDSWFPGYAWTIGSCRHCGNHLGWKFTATKSDLHPKFFYGVTREAIAPELKGDIEFR